jgi:hypothetical protein
MESRTSVLLIGTCLFVGSTLICAFSPSLLKSYHSRKISAASSSSRSSLSSSSGSSSSSTSSSSSKPSKKDVAVLIELRLPRFPLAQGEEGQRRYLQQLLSNDEIVTHVISKEAFQQLFIVVRAPPEQDGDSSAAANSTPPTATMTAFMTDYISKLYSKVWL